MSCGEQPPGLSSPVEMLLVLGAPLTDGSCCWPLLSPEEMRDAIVQAARESEEMRGAWWSKLSGNGELCWAQELF